MVFFWAFGDVIKLIFLFFNHQPIQLFLTSSFIVGVELMIMFQFLLYPSKAKEESAPETPTESNQTEVEAMPTVITEKDND